MTVELLPAGAGRDEWLTARQDGIGASEIAAVLGISPWESPFSLYWRKVNGWQTETTDDMSTGTRLEPAIADWWADSHPESMVHQAGLYAHPDRPWQLATPDRLVHAPCMHCDGAGVLGDVDSGIAACSCLPVGAGPLLAVLECKWTGSWDGWGDPGSDDIPVYYRAQVLWQCDVLDLNEWHLAMLGPGGFRAYRGRRDESDLAVMREAGRRFMARIAAGDPPDVDEHSATIATIKRLHPDLEDGEAEISETTAALYRRARALKASAERLCARAEARLRAELGDRRTAVHDGAKVATRSIYDTRRLDTTRLRADHPDLAAQYTTTTTTDRLTPARSSK